jgi:hypothetical protein
MKKFILIAAVAFSFTACNSGANTEAPATTDSTTVDSVKVDTAKVAVDTTKAVDTAKAAK